MIVPRANWWRTIPASINPLRMALLSHAWTLGGPA